MTATNCKCGLRIINPVGNLTGNILLVGDLPDFEDVKYGSCLNGKSAVILRTELNRVGIALSQVGYTNFWSHFKGKECDESIQMDRLHKLITGKSHVLLLGSESTKHLFNKNAIDLSGIEMRHNMYTKTRFMVSVGLATASKDDLGELRIAMERFSNMIKEKK